VSDALQSIRLNLNGRAIDVAIAADETLLEVLRERLRHTGTKCGCDQGVCGACTVLVDGRPMCACLLLAAGCTDRAVTTIEGISSGRALGPVQQALIDAAGLQCGFCTPGMVLTLTALLEEYPRPSREEVRHALGGNLCRCTGYTKIVDAAMRAAGEQPT
jgi:carbon-monoxide dehydrogenase small subunit